MFGRMRGSNPRPSTYAAGAHPIELPRPAHYLKPNTLEVNFVVQSKSVFEKREHEISYISRRYEGDNSKNNQYYSPMQYVKLAADEKQIGHGEC